MRSQFLLTLFSIIVFCASVAIAATLPIADSNKSTTTTKDLDIEMRRGIEDDIDQRVDDAMDAAAAQEKNDKTPADSTPPTAAPKDDVIDNAEDTLPPSTPESPAASLAPGFGNFDSDGNSAISAQEFLLLRQKAGASAATMPSFESIDANQDGRIDQREFDNRPPGAGGAASAPGQPPVAE